jgi:hypothetical protein
LARRSTHPLDSRHHSPLAHQEQALHKHPRRRPTFQLGLQHRRSRGFRRRSHTPPARRQCNPLVAACRWPVWGWRAGRHRPRAGSTPYRRSANQRCRWSRCNPTTALQGQARQPTTVQVGDRTRDASTVSEPAFAVGTSATSRRC